MKHHEPAAWRVAGRVTAADQTRYEVDTKALVIAATDSGIYTCEDCGQGYQVNDVET